MLFQEGLLYAHQCAEQPLPPAAGSLRPLAWSFSEPRPQPVHPARPTHSRRPGLLTETRSPTFRAARSPVPGGRGCSGLGSRARSKSAQVQRQHACHAAQYVLLCSCALLATGHCGTGLWSQLLHKFAEMGMWKHAGACTRASVHMAVQNGNCTAAKTT